MRKPIGKTNSSNTNGGLGRYSFTIAAAALGFVFLAIVFAPLLSTIPHRPGKLTLCSNNIRQIILALQNYESAEGHFPPAWTVDENGHLLHGWRTLILPYLEENALYSAIDLTKPWDDPVNAQFAHRIPAVYQCPAERSRNAKDFTTPYIGVIGENTMWPPNGQTVRVPDIRDGTSHTIAIIESDAHRINWMAPDNLTYTELVRQIKRNQGDLFRSPHPGGVVVGLSEGSTRFFESDELANQIEAALTIAGNDGGLEN